MFITGLAITIFGITVIKEWFKCRYWEKVEGEIIGAYIRDLPVPEAKTHNYLTPEIVYEYKLPNGKEYFSNKISFIDIRNLPNISDNYYSGNFDEVRNFISKYDPGTKVVVYYNPNCPSEAILDNSLKLPLLIPFIFGLGLIYASLHFHIFSYFAIKAKN
ncbi:MAG TPA: DUF3592 domain-containing protein [Victivallales bacterium]|nr:DUF3592 domain-containing protein [Victivallales bacterium]